MNSHAPRQLESGPNKGKWHYTNSNRRTGTYPEGYCAEPGRCAHETAQEATECHRQYLLDTSLRFREDVPHEAGVTLQACAECKVVCTGFAEVGYGIPTMIYLCAPHRTREVVGKHFKHGSSFGSF